MWVTRVESILVRGFREALRAVARIYLEWFEVIFKRYGQWDRKGFSYYGYIGGAVHGRDLTNKVYAVVIVAAF